MPMSLQGGCPEAATIADYARSQLAVGTTVEVEAHLSTCRPCFQRLIAQGQPTLVPDIPQFHIVKEIGRGRFGVVYKVWWVADPQRIVALKVLSSPGQMEESRFDREVAVLQKLDSPGIVKCLAAGQAGDAKYYVMDYVEGVHLDEYLASSRRDLNQELAVFQKVCRAVADAHAAGVVHRDLKPSNILVDADGQPHILDFGICGVAPSDWSSWQRQTITHPGDVVGTLKYMSPEQAWGGVAGPIDARSDIWSLGVMLYGIATGGDYPYSMRSTRDKPAPEALLERIRKELPRLPRLELLPRGHDLGVLLERCLAWEPDRRIESAAKLADDVERYCAGQHVKTRPLWLPYRLKRLVVGAATRSRAAFSVAFVAGVCAMLWALPFVVDIAWKVPGSEHLSGAAAGAAHAAEGLEVLVVGVFDGTVSAVVDQAAAGGFNGVNADLRTWRGVHGHLMERLARVRPSAVVWDYYFASPQAADEQLVAGVRVLEEAGVPVVVAASSYDDAGRPELSPGLLEPLGDRLRHGAIAARDMVERPGEFVMAYQRGDGAIVPGLALTALAALLHPGAMLEVEWFGRDETMSLLYRSGPGAYLRERDRIQLTRQFRAGEDEPDQRPDDLLGCNKFALHRPEYWQQRTVAYEALLRSNEEELRNLARDKLIIVGDLRTRQRGFVPDRHTVKFGATTVEDVPGCYLLADAVTGLLNQSYLKATNPLPASSLLGMLLVAAIGAVVPIKLAAADVFDRAVVRGALWLGLLALAAASLGVMVAAKTFAVVHVGMAGFCLAGPLAGAFAVEFARNRHRILDRSRRAIEEHSLGTRGTITVTPRRPKSHSSAE